MLLLFLHCFHISILNLYMRDVRTINELSTYDNMRSQKLNAIYIYSPWLSMYLKCIIILVSLFFVFSQFRACCFAFAFHINCLPFSMRSIHAFTFNFWFWFWFFFLTVVVFLFSYVTHQIKRAKPV